MALGALKALDIFGKAPAGPVLQVTKMLKQTIHMRPAEGGAFPLPSLVGICLPALS